MPVDTRLIGDRGTYLVAAELARHEWPAALTTTGTARTDLLAQVGDAKLPAAIQVKAKSGGSRDFQLQGVRDPAEKGANEWVVLVALAADHDHSFYVVPRDVVVAVILAFRDVYPRSSRVTLGEPEFEGYGRDDRWELLHHPSWEASWRVKRWVAERRDTLPWPDGRNRMSRKDVEILDA